LEITIATDKSSTTRFGFEASISNVPGDCSVEC
jgi:hypothetical protein